MKLQQRSSVTSNPWKRCRGDRPSALIHGTAAIRVILRDVRGNLHMTQFGDEVVGVVTLVRSECDAVCARQTFSHQQRCIAFCRTRTLEW
jgi:hypothetical protein